MHLNHATTAMASYQHYAPPQLTTPHSGTTTNPVQQQTTITSQLQQAPFTLHQLTAVQAIQHPTHQAILHPQHPLVHLLDISSTSNTNPTPISPTKVEIQNVIKEEEVVVAPIIDDPRKKKECHICKNKFRQLTTLRNHLKIHTDERPYKCKHCDKAFRQVSTLTNHVKIHTGEKPFNCTICAKDFRQQSTLINHIKTHKVQESTPTSLLNYQPQQATSPTKGRGKNSQGSYSSPQAEELAKPYQCSHCKKRFPQLTTLQNHERTHIDPKPYKCDTCEKSFSQLATLANHKKIHTGVKPYTCSYCSMQFRQSSTLNNHLKTHAQHQAAIANNPGGGQNPGGVQGNPANTHTEQKFQFQQKTQLGMGGQTAGFNGNPQHLQGVVNPATVLHQQLQVEHPLLHFLDTTTTVNVIPKEHLQNQRPTVTKLGPGVVIKLENSDRPFMCGLCRRTFIQQSTLTNHLKTHTGEKPYQCKVCEAHFRQLSTLNNHMKIHTGEKPYSCSYCPKQFRQKSTLTNHIRVHTC